MLVLLYTLFIEYLELALAVLQSAVHQQLLSRTERRRKKENFEFQFLSVKINSSLHQQTWRLVTQRCQFASLGAVWVKTCKSELCKIARRYHKKTPVRTGKARPSQLPAQAQYFHFYCTKAWRARNLSFNNGDGNEKGEKAIGFKTATLHVYHAFFYISLP